jgi:hypothetical protein
MIAEFEQRLADILGSRLPAPHTGNVIVAGDTSQANIAIFLGVRQAKLISPDIGSRRPEIAPGADSQRRIVRLRCTVGVDMTPRNANVSRTSMVQALDATLYTLEESDILDGQALADGGDPGFLIERIRVLDTVAPFDPHSPDTPAIGLTMSAEGWFWPVGEAGETGEPIGEVRVRGAVLPLTIIPARPAPTAGGPPIELTLSFQARGTFTLDGSKEPVPLLPFGRLTVALFAPGGQSGAGQLSGGDDGADGARLVTVSDGTASVTYTPPAEPAVDELVVALEGIEGQLGVELGRLKLEVRA